MMVVSLSDFGIGRLYPQYIFLVLIYVRDCFDPMAPSATGSIMSMKNSNDTIGNRTHIIPSFSAVPQRVSPCTVRKGLCKFVIISSGILLRMKNVLCRHFRENQNKHVFCSTTFLPNFLGVNAAGAYGWQPYHLSVPLSWNLGTLTSWNPLGHSRPVRKADNLTTSLCLCHEIWEP